MSCGATRTASSSKKATSSVQNQLIEHGQKYMGKPYRYAAKGPNSFDCSGYTSFIFREFGYNLSPSSAGQDKQVPTIKRKKDLAKGDLVFFEGRSCNGRVGHVGIVTETYANGDFNFIHASTNRGVIISKSTENYYASRYLRGGRVLKENDLLVTSSPKNTSKSRKNKKQSKKTNKPVYPIPTHKTNETIEPQEIVMAVIAQPSESLASMPTEKQDTLIVHSRPVNTPLPVSTPDQRQNDSIQSYDSKAILRRDSEEEQTTTITPDNNDTGSNNLTHEVKPGETLYSISQKYNCAVEQLRQWNPHMGNVLKSGEQLNILLK